MHSDYYGLTFQPAVDREPRPVSIFRVDPANGAAPRRAVDVLRAGGLVVLPTDEGYVVACNGRHAPAVARLRAVTGAAYEALRWFAVSPEQAATLGAAPTPVRHPVPRALMEAAGLPLAAAPPRPGGAPVPSAQQVIFTVGDAVDLVLDVGRVRLGPGNGGRSVRVVLGGDHAGVLLKAEIARLLLELGHEVRDLGTTSPEPVDYPDFCIAVAEAVSRGEADRGIIFGGTGNGEAIAANKVKGIRCAVVHDVTTARLARYHNDANMIALGARIVGSEVAKEIVRTFLTTPFEGGRHIPRIDKITRYERERKS